VKTVPTRQNRRRKPLRALCLALLVLANGKKLVVTERSRLELLRNELSLQMSGDVSDESAVSLGKRPGAQVIITGSLTDFGGSYRCRFNAIDIETAVRQLSPAVTPGKEAAADFTRALAVKAPPTGNGFCGSIPSTPIRGVILLQGAISGWNTPRKTK
jgi:hypothetical protein